MDEGEIRLTIMPPDVSYFDQAQQLRARTHELQERHDKEMSAARKELKELRRSRDFFMSLWWQHHPLIADREMTMADCMRLRSVRDACASVMLAAHAALVKDQDR